MPPDSGRHRFAELAPVPPSSHADFARWGDVLAKWNARINLVAPGTLEDFWIRHALDSAQVVEHIGNAGVVADFGSGGGFPALAVAIHAKHAGIQRHVHLIESAGKKASFLRTVVRELGLPATVHRARIENVASLGAGAITARAFAPLPRMLPLAQHHLAPGGRIVLLKGASVDDEIRCAREAWRFELSTYPSLSDASGRIIVLSHIQER